jgi:hypothetical protein
MDGFLCFRLGFCSGKASGYVMKVIEQLVEAAEEWDSKLSEEKVNSTENDQEIFLNTI